MNTQKCKGLLGEMGYVQELCKKCNAHLYESKCFGTTEYICLNGCHLSEGSLKRFNHQIKESADSVLEGSAK